MTDYSPSTDDGQTTSTTKKLDERVAKINVLPPEDDKYLGKRIFEILDEILTYKENLGLPSKWTTYHEWAKNKHWKTDTVKGSSLVSANFLFAHRENNVALLTDNNPTFNVVPGRGQNDKSSIPDPATAEFSDEIPIHERLFRASEYWWGDTEQQEIFEHSVSESETLGCIVEKVAFNPDLEGGLGEVETESISPFYFGVFPTKTMSVQKAEALLHFRVMSVREARRMYPDMADKILPDLEVLEKIRDDRLEIQAGKGQDTGYVTTISNVVKTVLNYAGGRPGDGSKLDEDVVIIECWAKDYTLKDEGKTSKYRGNIRCVTTCNGGNLILSDRDNPSINPLRKREEISKTWLFDKFPFSITPSIWDPTNIWGMSDFEQLKGLQKEIDKTLSQMTLVKDNVSRLKQINPLNSGVSNDQFDNAPGILNPSTAQTGQGIRYMDPPKLPIDLYKDLEFYKDMFYSVSGAFLLEQAQTPGREVIAYKAIAALLEKAAILLKKKNRNYSRMIRLRGRMFLSHVMNWYTEDRWISYEEDGQTKELKIRADEVTIPAKLTVVIGSTMPVSKMQSREEAIGLFKLTAIDIEELLKTIDWPKWKDVVKRMKSGPFAEFLDRLAMAGVPPEFLQLFQQISNMDVQRFKQALKAGEIPQFGEIIAAMAKEMADAPPRLDPMQEAERMVLVAETESKIKEADLKAAQTEKVKMEKNLALAKIETEEVSQYVMIQGVDLDKEKMKVIKAEVAAKLEKQEQDEIMDEAKTAAGLDKTAADTYSTVEGVRQTDEAAEAAKEESATKGFVKSSKQRGTKPYQEKGFRSNNKDVKP